MSAVSRLPSSAFQLPSLSNKISNYFILGLQPHEKAAMHVEGQYNRTFSRRIYLKMELSFQRGEMLLFLTTNMAAVMSRAKQVVYRYSQLTILLLFCIIHHLPITTLISFMGTYEPTIDLLPTSVAS